MDNFIILPTEDKEAEVVINNLTISELKQLVSKLEEMYPEELYCVNLFSDNSYSVCKVVGAYEKYVTILIGSGAKII